MLVTGFMECRHILFFRWNHERKPDAKKEASNPVFGEGPEKYSKKYSFGA
jgi:hypothetical protein